MAEGHWIFRSALANLSHRLWTILARHQTPLALVVVTGLLGLNWWKHPPPQHLWNDDEPVYLSIAYDVLHFGRFTDGSAWSIPSVDPARPPGMNRTPLYPLFLAAAAALDPAFSETLNCMVEQAASPACTQRAPLPRILQFAMVAASYLMLWRTATLAAGSQRIGWLSLGLALMTAPVLIGTVNTLMTEALTWFFTTGATLAAVRAVRASPCVGWAAVSGAMLGLAGLTRPPFVYLFPVVVILATLMTTGRPHWLRGLALLAAFCCAGAVVILPWILRNAVVLGHWDVTYGYAWMALTQRVAFDLMSWREYALSYLCYLPDGTGISKAMVGPHACDMFNFDITEDTFYGIGTTTLVQSTLRAAGGPQHHVSYLLHTYVMAQPVWHALVSIPMAMRGMWINKYWGLFMALLCMKLTWRAMRAMDPSMLAITLPGWIMLAFYAATSANQHRFNYMLIIPYSLAGGIELDRLLLRYGTYKK